MNYLLHKQKCPGHVIPQPNGLRELLADVSREVLRSQPQNVLSFIADYLDAMLLTREHTRIAEATLDDVLGYATDVALFCKTTDLPSSKARHVSQVFQRHLRESVGQVEARCDDDARFNGNRLMHRLMAECGLTADEASKAVKIVREAYEKYIYRHKGVTGWTGAIENSLLIYSQARPTQQEMDRAATCLQAAYRGYCVRKAAREQQNRAAVAIQSAYRGHRTRAELARDTDEAALIIQSIYRGHKTREDLDVVVEKVETEPSEVQEAALVVQNIFRGHKTRQKLKSPEKKASETSLASLIEVKSLELPQKPSKSSVRSIKSTTSVKSTSSVKSFSSRGSK